MAKHDFATNTINSGDSQSEMPTLKALSGVSGISANDFKGKGTTWPMQLHSNKSTLANWDQFPLKKQTRSTQRVSKIEILAVLSMTRGAKSTCNCTNADSILRNALCLKSPQRHYKGL